MNAKQEFELITESQLLEYKKALFKNVTSNDAKRLKKLGIKLYFDIKALLQVIAVEEEASQSDENEQCPYCGNTRSSRNIIDVDANNVNAANSNNDNADGASLAATSTNERDSDSGPGDESLAASRCEPLMDNGDEQLAAPGNRPLADHGGKPPAATLSSIIRDDKNADKKSHNVHSSSSESTKAEVDFGNSEGTQNSSFIKLNLTQSSIVDDENSDAKSRSAHFSGSASKQTEVDFPTSENTQNSDFITSNSIQWSIVHDDNSDEKSGNVHFNVSASKQAQVDFPTSQNISLDFIKSNPIQSSIVQDENLDSKSGNVHSSVSALKQTEVGFPTSQNTQNSDFITSSSIQWSIDHDDSSDEKSGNVHFSVSASKQTEVDFPTSENIQNSDFINTNLTQPPIVYDENSNAKLCDVPSDSASKQTEFDFLTSENTENSHIKLVSAVSGPDKNDGVNSVSRSSGYSKTKLSTPKEENVNQRENQNYDENYVNLQNRGPEIMISTTNSEETNNCLLKNKKIDPEENSNDYFRINAGKENALAAKKLFPFILQDNHFYNDIVRCLIGFESCLINVDNSFSTCIDTKSENLKFLCLITRMISEQNPSCFEDESVINWYNNNQSNIQYVISENDFKLIAEKPLTALIEGGHQDISKKVEIFKQLTFFQYCCLRAAFSDDKKDPLTKVTLDCAKEVLNFILPILKEYLGSMPKIMSADDKNYQRQLTDSPKYNKLMQKLFGKNLKNPVRALTSPVVSKKRKIDFNNDENGDRKNDENELKFGDFVSKFESLDYSETDSDDNLSDTLIIDESANLDDTDFNKILLPPTVNSDYNDVKIPPKCIKKIDDKIIMDYRKPYQIVDKFGNDPRKKMFENLADHFVDQDIQRVKIRYLNSQYHNIAFKKTQLFNLKKGNGGFLKNNRKANKNRTAKKSKAISLE